ncbi:MAG: DUF6483 family protein [Oscillospiraceae bacterium]|jgi:hypothetical protein|nr:DUF6483 family protein [Oscillospiraceae bacterium]
MYFQQDTVMRLIEMLGAAFRQMMRLLDDTEAEIALDDAWHRLCGLKRATAEGMSVDALIALLPPDRRLAMAELLAMEAKRFERRLDADDLRDKLHRALLLLLSTDDDTVAKLCAHRAKELFQGCAEIVTPTQTTALLHFFILGGAYALGEDVLFDQLRSLGRPADQAATLRAGQAFYERLQGLDDDRLAQGNLPRDEVLQGQAALKDWAAAHPQAQA